VIKLESSLQARELSFNVRWMMRAATFALSLLAFGQPAHSSALAPSGPGGRLLPQSEASVIAAKALDAASTADLSGITIAGRGSHGDGDDGGSDDGGGGNRGRGGSSGGDMRSPSLSSLWGVGLSDRSLAQQNEVSLIISKALVARNWAEADRVIIAGRGGSGGGDRGGGHGGKGGGSGTHRDGDDD